MKNKELVQLYLIFKGLSKAKTPIGLTIAKNIRSLEPLYLKHKANIISIENKYLEKDDNGKFIGIEKDGKNIENPKLYKDIKCKDRDKFNKEIQNIDNEIITPIIYKINIKKKYIENKRERFVEQWLEENILPNVLLILMHHKII